MNVYISFRLQVKNKTIYNSRGQIIDYTWMINVDMNQIVHACIMSPNLTSGNTCGKGELIT